MDDVLVSINCITYNHENYIRDALEGFLMQKTNFKYEILIHDDASTDKTADIIREYENKYPELIKPIYQTENQYSKGIRVGILNIKRGKGKYIAACEGDDYWIDSYKLQKQIDYMERNPSCSLCFHDAIVVNRDKTIIGPHHGIYKRVNGIKNIDELSSIPTASKLYRKTVFNENVIPDWYYKAPYGDFSNMLVCSNYGDIYYINEKMSAYRTNVPESVMYNHRIKNKEGNEFPISINKRRIEELNSYNEWSNYKNDIYVRNLILEREIALIVLEGRCKELKEKKYTSILNNINKYKVIKLYIKCMIPYKIYLKISNIKSKLKKGTNNLIKRSKQQAT